MRSCLSCRWSQFGCHSLHWRRDGEQMFQWHMITFHWWVNSERTGFVEMAKTFNSLTVYRAAKKNLPPPVTQLLPLHVTKDIYKGMSHREQPQILGQFVPTGNRSRQQLQGYRNSGFPSESETSCCAVHYTLTIWSQTSPTDGAAGLLCVNTGSMEVKEGPERH